MSAAGPAHSLRTRLLLSILLPTLLLVGVEAAVLYQQALRAANEAYDRTLLASAKAIGELLAVSAPVAEGAPPTLRAVVPYAALEPFEGGESRLVYSVTGFQGELVSGYAGMPPWRGTLPDTTPYRALVDFYDGRFEEEPVRAVVLLQPVVGTAGFGMARIQVAETLELRQAMARRILLDTLWSKAALVAVLLLVVGLAVQRATRPVQALSAALTGREASDLTPVSAPDAPRELAPIIEATNGVLARLAQLHEHQRRFVRDVSHQLRTPLAVLKAQVQSARRGDAPAALALQEIDATVQSATELANQMLALAKVEQLRQQGLGNALPPEPWDAVVRAVSLELAPLVAAGGIDFELVAAPTPVHAHAWALRELARNLLHNAIKHSPPGAPLVVRIGPVGDDAWLEVDDSGPGLAAGQQEQLFRPFSAAGAHAGAGLGLAICHEIVRSLGGELSLVNHARRPGLVARARLPLACPGPK
ncbi:MAG: sensor histidine kinase [Rubrivivax sp.]|nr:sensor histidine kinase [Rubrivivax sp.]